MPTDTQRDPIPLRALNQVTYCRRLYFLQYVDNVVPVNEHIEGGLHDHRRVDDPALAGRTRTDGEVKKTRGVMLSSEALGLCGIPDLFDETDGEIVPVETKHGSPPHDDDGKPTVWDNDAVQLCGQGMLLEEQYGREVKRGYQFYAGSREKIEVPFDEVLRQKTFSAIAACREVSAMDAPPPPLPNALRHRCFGCSLATVCLPEETMFQIAGIGGEAEADHPAITRVIPQSDDGAVLYLQEPFSHVGKRSEHLVVRKDNRELAKVPMHAVRQVCVFGNVQVSTQALQTLLENEIPVIYLTGYGRFIGSFLPAPAKNVGLREAQYRMFSDAGASLLLARATIAAKLSNQRTLLMRALRGDGDRGSEEPAARAMADLIKSAQRAGSVETLLGLEGQGAALYFGEFGRFLKVMPPGQGFDFTVRNRRPPRDPVNALLSFAYAMLTKDAFSAACVVGFDPYKGFMHVNRHGKPSLALDLMEEFRPVISDSVVLTLLNNEMLTKGDFITWRDSCQLNDAGRKKFFQAYETRKSTVVTHPVYGYRMSYSRMLEVQARMLAAWVRGGVGTYTGFTVR